MPFYRLICRDCGETFDKHTSIKERSEKRISCPKCGSIQLENDYSAGSANIRKGDADKAVCPHSDACGCHCNGNSSHSCIDRGR